MLKYIVNDIAAVFRYLPYGIVAGIIVAIVLSAVNDRRLKRSGRPFPYASLTFYFMYLVIMVFITFLSRESGSRKGIDLQLLSTWGINTRNNAFVVENILLFIPYGFVCAWAVKSARKFLMCTLYGFLTSLAIETMQLFTQRGFFQVDDILTNTIGTVIGFIFFRCILKEEQADSQKTKFIYVILSVVMLAGMIMGMVAFSSESPEASNELSMKVSRFVVNKASGWLDLDMSAQDKTVVIHFLNPVLRKLAHASEYGALAVVIGFGFQMLKRSRTKVVNYFYAVLLCAGIALADEFLQKFMLGGNGRWADVALDLIGAVIGGCVYVFLGELFAFLSGDSRPCEYES